MWVAIKRPGFFWERFFILFSFHLFLKAQGSYGQANLVPNPGFEDTVQCPNQVNIAFASGWINCGFTPDYYNACANTTFPGLGVPSGLYSGYQQAFEGNAYAGIVTFQDQANEHEFIAIKLTQPLLPQVKYYVSAQIVQGVYKCAANKFGFKFFTVMPFSQLNPPPVDNFSHVNSNTVITDSTNWNQISGSFVADSAYQYLVLGNFHDNNNTDTMHCSPPGDGAYYLVDAVCVTDDSITCINWTSIDINRKSSPIIFPNPASEYLYVTELKRRSSFSILNNVGIIEIKGEVSANHNIISVSSLPEGLYIIEFDKRHFKKFIKQHNH